jgi:hypothetical protein
MMYPSEPARPAKIVEILIFLQEIVKQAPEMFS